MLRPDRPLRNNSSGVRGFPRQLHHEITGVPENISPVAGTLGAAPLLGQLALQNCNPHRSPLSHKRNRSAVLLSNQARPFVTGTPNPVYTSIKPLVFAKKFRETLVAVGNLDLATSEVKLTLPILTLTKHIPNISPNIGVFHPNSARMQNANIR
jgi:hypothetical protein